ncbi:hypothetical protein M501DRAFT_960888 [Patellaria atrata CBS 101060]|uniref:Uncharacterized protein n=1 Tax=Patellaria atrata CBS 101060 TaxID=1346257 RepID=A0A9P4S4M4_9PEZI|nr:hypothetical protein M501DRAFT_960888 [Patellaria atrata CBS 101060]
MSIWQSYRNLSPKTRTLFGLGVIAWAGIGLMATEKAEKKFGFEPTDQDRKELDRILPKVRVVDKDDI